MYNGASEKFEFIGIDSGLLNICKPLFTFILTEVSDEFMKPLKQSLTKNSTGNP